MSVASAETGAASQGASRTAPQRVVSINLCTDQLAMLMAAPGQLLSVTHVSLDKRVSPLAEQAAQYRVNYGLAEEIFSLRPDLVLAGAYTPRQTTAMLDRLGIRVELFQPVTSLEDLRASLAQMGAALHREDEAARHIDAFDAGLALATQADAGQGPGPLAAIYYANGFTAGDTSLAHELMTVAGLRNAAVAAGYTAGGKLALETLAMIQPEMMITAQRYPGGSRAEEVLDHPVVTALRSSASGAVMSDQDWVCGTPFVLNAIQDMAHARHALHSGAQ
ncbi:ABC transporter substrate-binding protein [Roseovarius aestuarii]|nr:ABC transporter substrate-binding protein [Roseovarius aestuarii]